MAAFNVESTDASGSFCTYTTDITASPQIDWISHFATLDYLEVTNYVDVKEIINHLHVVEHRKALFRVASITPNSHNYKQKITNHNIPSSRNFKGNQVRRV